MAIALLLFAVDRHWSGCERQALLLLAAVSLARPEAFALVLAYGLIFRRRAGTGVVAVTVATVLALWLVPDWIGSGNPLHGGEVAKALNPHGLHAALAALGEGVSIAPLPLSLAAIAGFAIARRHGDRRVLELSLVAVAWAALLLVMTASGYPASGRFYVLPAALVSVLGAAGTVEAARIPVRGTRLAAAATVAALPLVVVTAADAGGEARDAVQRARVEANLSQAIERAGPGRLRECGVPVLPRGLNWMRGDVAWHLGVPLNRVRSVETSGRGYIADLTRFGRGAATAPVVARDPDSPTVVLEPFGTSPVHWRVRGFCRRVPTRAV